MKRILLPLALLLVLLFGCAKQETVVFTGIIEEIHENGVLVVTDELSASDRASVGFAKNMEPIGFNLIVGQTVRVTILPEIRESYPVQVTAVKLELQEQQQNTAAPNAPDKEDESMNSLSAAVNTITPEQAKEIMDNNPDSVILDVRTQEEYDEGHIPGAVLLPDFEVTSRAPEVLPDKDAVILVYCRSGRRSALAAEALAQMGYTEVSDFGGIIDWPYETTKPNQ